MLVTESAKKLNFFPSKNGVSKYYSPRMILHQRNLDYDRHCKYALGTYVQAHDEPKFSNTNATPRSLDCIYLRYNDSVQGGHELLHLQTNSVLRRRTVTPVPITPAIIKQVHTLAATENMPAGLKLVNRTGQVFYDSAWIAGVDYDEEAFDDEDDPEDYEENDSNRDDDDLPMGQFDAIDEEDVTVNDDDEESDDGNASGNGNESDSEDDDDPHGNNAGVVPNNEQSTNNANEGNTDTESEEQEEDEEEQEDLNPATSNDEHGGNQDMVTTRSLGQSIKAASKIDAGSNPSQSRRVQFGKRESHRDDDVLYARHGNPQPSKKESVPICSVLWPNERSQKVR